LFDFNEFLWTDYVNIMEDVPVATILFVM